MSFLPILLARRVPDRGRMTSTTTSTGRISRIRDRIADLARTQQVLLASMERIDPDPDPYLHWEPTTAGWRLYGHLAPPV